MEPWGPGFACAWRAYLWLGGVAGAFGVPGASPLQYEGPHCPPPSALGWGHDRCEGMPPRVFFDPDGLQVAVATWFLPGSLELM